MVRLSDGSLDEHLVDAAGQPSQPSVRPAPKDGDHIHGARRGECRDLSNRKWGLCGIRHVNDKTIYN